MGYGGYYQQCGMTPQQQQAAAMHMAAAGHLASSPLNHLPTARSPVASPPPQVSAATQNLLSHQGGGSLGLGGGGGPFIAPPRFSDTCSWAAAVDGCAVFDTNVKL